MKKVLSADVLSPILAYMRLDAPHKMILESIPREKENARFSIVAYRPSLNMASSITMIRLSKRILWTF